MENDVYLKKLSKKHCPQFGKVAVDMGFITAEQLKQAIPEQVDDDLADKPHRFIGMMLFEDGWITNEQINIVYYIMRGYTSPL